MFRKAYENDFLNLSFLLKKDVFQNAYLYIDSLEYGFENGKTIETFIVEENEKICVIIYKYYNSIQLFEVETASDSSYKQIAEYIIDNSIKMISGNTDITNRIFSFLPAAFSIYYGYILTGENAEKIISKEVALADEEQLTDIAELICSDYSIGGHYTVELLIEQMKDRMKNHHCRNLILQKDSVVVSHMATYAECDNIAVMGGLITLPEYRDKGYGSCVISSLAQILISEGKTPIIHCYRDSLKDWYVSKGWKLKHVCAKIEFND